MHRPDPNFTSEESKGNLIKHCELVIKGIKKERKMMRSKLQTLAWRQKRYEQMIDDARQMRLFTDPEL